MSAHDDEQLAHQVNPYGSGGAERRVTPGRSTLTARMPASARSIARAVMAEMNGVAPGADALVARAAEGAGHALPGELRGRFEASLGTDLGGVRVHSDAAAAEASSALGARAFATGQDVFMGAGQYAPHSSDGAFLLAHEVAHTVQQRGASAGPQLKLEVSSPGDAMETEADAAAVAMMSGLPTRVSAARGVGRLIARTGEGERRSEAGHGEPAHGEPAHGEEHRGTPVAMGFSHETPARTFHITGEDSYVNVEVEMRLRGRLLVGANGEHHREVGGQVLGTQMGTPAPREEGGVEGGISTNPNGAGVEQVGGLRAALPQLFSRISPRVRDSVGLEGGEHGATGHVGLLVDLGELGGHPVTARFNLIRRAGEEHPHVEFASLTLATTFEIASFRLQQQDGTSMNVALSIPVEMHISPNWPRIGRYLLERFGVQVATNAAPVAAAGAGGVGTGAAGGGAGTGGGGAGAGETAMAGGGAEAAIDLAISAGFIAGAIITVAATLASFMEMDDADGAARHIPTVQNQLVEGFLAGMRGDPRPADRILALGWERGQVERTTTLNDALRANPASNAGELGAAITDLTNERAAGLRALVHPRFHRLAQAIMWHSYARRHRGDEHALDLGWRYIWQGESDAEIQQLYRMYSDAH